MGLDQCFLGRFNTEAEALSAVKAWAAQKWQHALATRAAENNSDDETAESDNDTENTPAEDIHAVEAVGDNDDEKAKDIIAELLRGAATRDNLQTLFQTCDFGNNNAQYTWKVQSITK